MMGTMKVSKGKRIKMEYELAVKGGEVIESSTASGAIEYIHGSGRMLPGLESRIEGLTVDDEKEGIIPAAEAYGRPDDLPTRQLSKSEFGGEDVEVGKQFTAKGPDGNPVTFVVEKIDGDDVTVRFTHPLAGKDITFKVKILEVSEPN